MVPPGAGAWPHDAGAARRGQRAHRGDRRDAVRPRRGGRRRHRQAGLGAGTGASRGRKRRADGKGWDGFLRNRF